MTDIKLLNLTNHEKEQLKEEIDGDNVGCGVIYTGKYYISLYRPLKDTNHINKCKGVTIIVKKIENNDYDIPYSPPIDVPYKEGFLTLNREPFKDRLADAIKKQTNRVIELDKRIDDEIERVAREKAAREKAIKDHIEKTRSCQLKIDSTIKILAPNAKSMIEIQNDHLLAESKNDCIENTPFEEVISKAFMETSNEQGTYYKYDPKKHYPSEKEQHESVNDAILHPKDIFHRAKCNVPEKIVVVEPELIKPGDINYLTSVERNNKPTTV